MAHKHLDVCGEICPDPLNLTMKAVAGLSPGDQLRVILDSPMALETISRWAGRVGHQVLEVREAGAGVWEITLKKR